MPNWIEIHFSDDFSSKKIRKTRKNFATVLFGGETGSQLKLQKFVFSFKDKFHAQLIGNQFSDNFSSNKVRKSRKNFATVFFGAESGSQLTLQTLFLGFKDKFHGQFIGNHFSDNFSSEKVSRSRKNFATDFFGAENGSLLKLQNIVFVLTDKFHAQSIGNLFFSSFHFKKSKKIEKKICNGLFGSGNWVPVNTPKT